MAINTLVNDLSHLIDSYFLYQSQEVENLYLNLRPNISKAELDESVFRFTMSALQQKKDLKVQFYETTLSKEYYSFIRKIREVHFLYTYDKANIDDRVLNRVEGLYTKGKDISNVLSLDSKKLIEASYLFHIAPEVINASNFYHRNDFESFEEKIKTVYSQSKLLNDDLDGLCDKIKVDFDNQILKTITYLHFFIDDLLNNKKSINRNNDSFLYATESLDVFLDYDILSVIPDNFNYLKAPASLLLLHLV